MNIVVENEIATITADNNITLSLDSSILDGTYTPYNTVVNCDTEEISSVKTVILGEGISAVDSLRGFDNAETLIITNYVKSISARALVKSNFSDIIITDELPEYVASSLLTTKVGTVYIQESTGLAGYVGGKKIRYIGTEYVADSITDMLITEYTVASANQAITMAEGIVSSATTDITKALLLYPYSSPTEFTEIKEFTVDLCKEYETEEEKCLAIYSYIAAHVRYDDAAGTYTTYQCFTEMVNNGEGRGVCAQYTTLMHDMLSAVGITSFYISGTTSSLDGVNTENRTTAVKYGQLYTTADAINWHNYALRGHAFILAKVNGTWKYYDPTAGIENTYGMSAEKLISCGRYPIELEGISLLPESIDLINLDSTRYFYRDGELRSNTVGGNSSIIYNAGFTINHRVYGDTFNYSSAKATYLEDTVGFGELTTNMIYKINNWYVATGSGREIGYDDAMTYLENELGSAAIENIQISK